ncbi:MAG TPA: FAD-binding oxidoreductase [Candidatus Acidoferrales bacterium]|nr:FAD-binding oxidoreductase [Candidatus Acidoferrales bacterium]
MPQEVDFAIVGGGFTGLSAAAWLRHLDPQKSVALFEAESVGAGASGRTGGMTLAESAAGDLPGLGDVLEGFSKVLTALGVDCDLSLPGAWELGREDARADSPINWTDSGKLRVVDEVPGGSADPGKLVSGLARAADRLGALIFEDSRVEKIAFDDPLRLDIRGQEVRARRVLLATNAMSLELNSLANRAAPKFTLAVATAPITDSQIAKLGLASRRSFYTVDLPYLWGRLLSNNSVICGSGLVHLRHWSELDALDVATGVPAELFASIEGRIRNLHPALCSAQFTHRWGGPILFANDWRPVFARHPKSPRAIVLGAYSGHGVALSVYLGSWAAEVMFGRRDLPDW